MTKIKRSIIPILAMMLIASCGKKPMTVSRVSSTTDIGVGGVIYTLPRTVFKIRVDAVKQVSVPGPYAKFAQKYLGIADAPQARVEEWRIVNVDLVSAVESDPSFLFSAVPGDDQPVDFLRLSSAGLIIPMQRLLSNSVLAKELMVTKLDEGVIYKDLSPDLFISTEKSTFYSSVQRDSGFVRVPVQKSQVVEKSLEEKAKEAADFIFTLRKRRIEFLSFDADHKLDGEGLKSVFSEIRNLEDEYLSLFIGKRFSENAIGRYEFIPTQPEGETAIICRFSTSRGLLPPSDLSGGPVLLKVIPERVPDNISTLFRELGLEKGKPVTSLVYYRMPIQATLKVSDAKADYLNTRELVFQYGPVFSLPPKFLLKESGFIELR